MNYFTLDLYGTVTYVNINSHPADWKISESQNIWMIYPSLKETNFYQACLQTLQDGKNRFIEEVINQKQVWEIQIYPLSSGLAIYAKEVSEKNQCEAQLRISQANLNATINNTEVLIYSLDKDLQFMSYNKPFENYLRKNYHVDPVNHPGFVKEFVQQEGAFPSRWRDVYHIVLSGGTIMFESSAFGQDYQFSLGPILEDGVVIGVTSFGCNITKRNARERDLSKANQTISHLKIMNLQSAMNSHFIFNTLNAIQFYILENDRKKAVHYLSSFSKLIRDVLVNTVADKVRLGNEINLLRNYISLEQMRFDNKFDVEFVVDPELESEIEIPPMLIQPYVENAIVHGLAHRKQGGHLKLSFKKHDAYLDIEIEDNGIGRRAASSLNERMRSTHQSVSSKMTEDRVRLINSMERVSLEIIDKYREGQPSGTLVVLSIEFVQDEREGMILDEIEKGSQLNIE